MSKLFALMILLSLVGCSNRMNPTVAQLPGNGDSPSLQNPLNPSDDFETSTFNSRRWTLVNFETTLPIIAISDGVKLGNNTQSQSFTEAFSLKTNYTAKINDIYGDSAIGELHVRVNSPNMGNQTGVTMYFANGKRVVSYIYTADKVYGRVDIYDMDGTTLLFHSTPIELGRFLDCEEYKVAVNYNADSTAQWNVNFSDNCATVGYVSQIALDHATLGGTDYIGNNNGKVRFELFGNREPVAPDSDTDPFFGFSGSTPITLAYSRTINTNYIYSTSLLTWNFSTSNVVVTEE